MKSVGYIPNSQILGFSGILFLTIQDGPSTTFVQNTWMVIEPFWVFTNAVFQSFSVMFSCSTVLQTFSLSNDVLVEEVIKCRSVSLIMCRFLGNWYWGYSHSCLMLWCYQASYLQIFENVFLGNLTSMTKWMDSDPLNMPGCLTVYVLVFQGFPAQQYGSGGMSGYPNQPLQYPTGPQQRCAPSPSYHSSRMPHMGQYTSGSHNPAQFPPGTGQPNPPHYYKVIRSTIRL